MEEGEGKMRRAIVRSRSWRNCGFVGARGPRCVEANVKAGVRRLGSRGALGEEAVVIVGRMSSTSWRRRSEKWRGVFLSRSCGFEGG